MHSYHNIPNQSKPVLIQIMKTSKTLKGIFCLPKNVQRMASSLLMLLFNILSLANSGSPTFIFGELTREIENINADVLRSPGNSKGAILKQFFKHCRQYISQFGRSLLFCKNALRLQLLREQFLPAVFVEGIPSVTNQASSHIQHCGEFLRLPFPR